MSGSGMIPAFRSMARRWLPNGMRARDLRFHPDAIDPVRAHAVPETWRWNLEGGALPSCPIHEAVVWIDVDEGAVDSDTLWLSVVQAKWMLVHIELGLSHSNWGDEIVMVRGTPFSRAECKAIQRVLTGVLAKLDEAA